MKKEIYTGTDAPVSISITHLASGYAVVICLGITSTEKEDDETEYTYTQISGIMPCISLQDIIGVIVQNDCISLIDIAFKSTLAEMFADYNRSHLISSIVRAKYSADDVEAIILNQGDGSDEHQQDYDNLQEWRKMAKEIAQ